MITMHDQFDCQKENFSSKGHKIYDFKCTYMYNYGSYNLQNSTKLDRNRR